jgi:hypothetical protein
MQLKRRIDWAANARRAGLSSVSDFGNPHSLEIALPQRENDASRRSSKLKTGGTPVLLHGRLDLHTSSTLTSLIVDKQSQ